MSMVKGINPGRLKHKVTIMRYQDTEDVMGNTVNVLNPIKSTWAEIRPLRGKEQLEYYKNTNEQSFKITIRHTDVTTKDVIVFRNRQFQINAISNPLEDDYILELLCTESVDHAVKEAEEETAGAPAGTEDETKPAAGADEDGGETA
ncbi:MAG: phage head closure protein [Oribacterium sp.]|nr:phage head closure protein [Oribacterium sp.]